MRIKTASILAAAVAAATLTTAQAADEPAKTPPKAHYQSPNEPFGRTAPRIVVPNPDPSVTAPLFVKECKAANDARIHNP
jgi:hypothetical protein